MNIIDSDRNLDKMYFHLRRYSRSLMVTRRVGETSSADLDAAEHSRELMSGILVRLPEK